MPIGIKPICFYHASLGVCIFVCRWVEMLEFNHGWESKTIVPKCEPILNAIDYPYHDTPLSKTCPSDRALTASYGACSPYPRYIIQMSTCCLHIGKKSNASVAHKSMSMSQNHIRIRKTGRKMKNEKRKVEKVSSSSRGMNLECAKASRHHQKRQER
jgi:hypothetical protein